MASSGGGHRRYSWATINLRVKQMVKVGKGKHGGKWVQLKVISANLDCETHVYEIK